MRYAGYVSTVSYGYDWYFDSTTKFIICTDSNTNAVHVACDVKSVSLFYTYAGDDGVFYFGGLYRKDFLVGGGSEVYYLAVQIAEYVLDSGGSSITPSIGSLGPTSFSKIFWGFF